MKGTNEVRKIFLDYFAGQKHEVVTSGPLVPQNDPTLMFTNAGMVPFKNLFTGAETRPYVRAVSSQKCVRAGGKHNDLDNVGYTARHHTFFEMLGNFSFGDYFKERAIYHAWTLLTKEYGLDPARLLVTVYHEDDEAYALWKEISGLPEDRIIRIATSDNFWSMGDTGPCGPCSEIFYDHGPHIMGGPPGSADEDGDRFVEIWNLVFMQYDQQADGTRLPLPKPSIDTGMGLERITAVLQGTHDNYEIDLFKNLIEASAKFSGVDAYGPQNISHRVIADHLRSACFLIADGVLPSNEGRGYVLRRIMRRGMRHAHLLGCRAPLMYRLVPALLQEMGQAFPELLRAEALITETLKLEELRFKKTLERGLRLLDDEIKKLPTGGELAGDIAFRLYDTYGFPLDLTQDVLRAQDLSVDEQGFQTAMEKQKAEARAAWKGSGSAATEQVWFEANTAHGATEFLGYTTTHSEGKILAIIKDDKLIESASVGDQVAILTNQTPFYAESGGQSGDIGTLTTSNGDTALVTDTVKKLGKLHVHMVKITKGAFSVAAIVDMKVDDGYRDKVRANHSVTHILHAVLRDHLGDHVTQKGSMVAADRLRFDFSHNKALTPPEKAAIEKTVNRIIRQNSTVTTQLMTPGEAVERGAMALFGEKYGDEVRVVSMGNGNYSTELCGGTHVSRTGDIGMFKIIAESAVAAGVRRLEAITGGAAVDHCLEQEHYLSDVTSMLKTTPVQLTERLASLLEDRKSAEKELVALRKKIAMGGGDSAGDEIKTIGDIKFIGRVLDGVHPKELRGMADDARERLGSGVVALVAVNDGKAGVLTAVTSDLISRINAVDLVRAGAMAVGGKGGGGRPDMAQAGGPDGRKASAAISAIEDILGAL
ncbi:Alanyl-tRNA synthetase [hydrothermal vent metagenome]|uniref:Alanine--tRNA ligase n=1 Tax=hydrothermal vent metagenome TaxID=652676 RepID=A0A3B0QZB4_9ZZZZ